MGTSEGNKNRKMYSKSEYRNKISDSKKLKEIVIIKICKCGKKFEIKRKISKNGLEIIPRFEKKCCSRSCANRRMHSKEEKEKISKSLKKEKTIKICPNCGIEYYSKFKSCSKKCAAKIRNKNCLVRELRQYRRKCDFRFKLEDYPNKFDLDLIEKYGLYNKDNLNGISKDHIVSVKWGFKNNIDPEIISHPANCQLMRHNENISKYDKSDISIEELLDRIKNF